jgi:hypothetical protein
MFANIIFVVLTFMPNLFQWLNLLCFLYPDFYYCSRSITIIWASRISLLGLIIPILSTFKTRNSGMILCTDEAHQSLIILYAQVLFLFEICQKFISQCLLLQYGSRIQIFLLWTANTGHIISPYQVECWRYQCFLF